MLPNDLEVTNVTETKEYKSIPEGLYPVVLEDINAEERPVYQHPDQKELVYNCQFVILEGEYGGERLWKRIRPVLSPGFENGNPSTLFVLLKALLGREPNLEAKITGQKLNALIGKQCQVLVKQEKGKNGKMYSKVTEFLAAKQQLPIPELKTKQAEIKKLEVEPVKEEASEIDYEEAPPIDPESIPF